MHADMLVTLLEQNYTTIGVCFKDSNTGLIGTKTYTYKTTLRLQPGDEVVVKSPRAGMVVAIVVRVDDIPAINTEAPFAYKWVVQHVDHAAYDHVTEVEERAKKLLAKARLKAARHKALQEIREGFGDCEEAKKDFDDMMTLLSGSKENGPV